MSTVLLEVILGGGGGILRPFEGMVFAFCRYYGHVTNTIAELRALIDGLKLCISMNILSISIESDSMVLIDVLHGKVNPPDHWGIFEFRDPFPDKELRKLSHGHCSSSRWQIINILMLRSSWSNHNVLVRYYP